MTLQNAPAGQMERAKVARRAPDREQNSTWGAGGFSMTLQIALEANVNLH